MTLLRAPHAERTVSYHDFMKACAALWTELHYQNNLSIRTANEATDVPGFATLGRVYLRKLEDAWTTAPGEIQEDGSVQVTEALHGLRKVAAIFVRAMIYCGVRDREMPPEPALPNVIATLDAGTAVDLGNDFKINWHTPQPDLTAEGLYGASIAGASYDFTLGDLTKPIYHDSQVGDSITLATGHVMCARNIPEG
jgi:hypothetical protein